MMDGSTVLATKYYRRWKRVVDNVDTVDRETWVYEYIFIKILFVIHRLLATKFYFNTYDF